MSKKNRVLGNLRDKGNMWIFLLLTLFSTGCSSFVKPQQPPVLNSITLDNSHSVGQTFVAKFDGMDGIEIYLEPQYGTDAEIQLILRESIHAENLGRSSLTTKEILTPGYYRFHLPIQVDSNQQNYYLILKVKGSGSFKVGTAPGNTYLNGALYQNNTPNNQEQMAFQLSYYLPRVGFGLLGEVFTWTLYLLVASFLFIIPGWASMDLAGWGQRAQSKKFHWSIKLTVSIGVSLALYTILFSWTDALDFHFGPLYAWLPPIFGLLVIVWQRRKYLKNIKTPTFKFSWRDFTFIAVIFIIFAARFWIIRSIPIPLWGDSQQHAMITQLIIDNDGLFSSWQPYAPYYSLTTHFGFSAFSALFAWITRLDGTQATLWMGQILNGLAILTLYPLAVKISRGNRWTGIGTIIASGLVFTIPAFYVNWGRYAQLSGQVILPIALWLLWTSIDRDQWAMRSEWPLLLLAGLAITGMTLSYYRMPFYFAAFVPILLVFWGLPKWRFNAKNWGNALLRILLIGMICLVLFVPWGSRLMDSNLANAIEAGTARSAPSSLILAELETMKAAVDYVPEISLMLAVIVLVWAIIRKNWLVATLPLWFVLLLGYRVGALARLPGANMLQGFAILIALYIPLGLLIGWFLGEIFDFISKSKSKWPVAIASSMIITLAAWFGWQQRLILDQRQYALVTYPDIKAFSWLETQTLADAQFLIQGFKYWATAAGSDGGWWLPLLAHRQNTIPPQYAQFNEIPQPPDFTKQVVDLVITLENHPIYEPESITALCNWGITHIYHGQGQGKVGNNGPQLFALDHLHSSPNQFSQIYHEDRVQIFEFNSTVCDNQP